MPASDSRRAGTTWHASRGGLHGRSRRWGRQTVHPLHGERAAPDVRSGGDTVIHRGRPLSRHAAGDRRVTMARKRGFDEVMIVNPSEPGFGTRGARMRFHYAEGPDYGYYAEPPEYGDYAEAPEYGNCAETPGYGCYGQAPEYGYYGQAPEYGYYGQAPE